MDKYLKRFLRTLVLVLVLVNLFLFRQMYAEIDRPTEPAAEIPSKAALGTALKAQAKPAVTITRELVAPGFQRPVFAISPPGEYDRFFVIEQQGSAGTANRADIKILHLKARTTNAKPFLSITGINTGNEEGLLGLAFHPSYASNGYFYTYHTKSDGNNYVTRWKVSATNPDSADPTSATQILQLLHPTNSNHNGGWIAFGPDGYLYIATGDGGGGGDVPNNAQNLSVPLGKMLRIDVDNGTPYGIPPTNPFVGGPQLQEIFYYGLRNPWRNSFDRGTGQLFIGDVGQNTYEEIDWRPASDTGNINFGWRLMEGLHCYNPPTNCDPLNITTKPIHEYTHGSGCSVTGGYVYRGCMIPDLAGTYFFADYCSARIWSFKYNGVSMIDFTERTAEIGGGTGIVSFAQDNKGEIYILYQNGNIYRIVPTTSFIDCNNNHLPDSCDIVSGTSFDINGDGIPDECGPLCGDSNSDGMVNVSDATYDISYIFAGGPPPSPLSVGDANCDGSVNISDAVYTIQYIFAGGPAPCASC